MAAFLPKTTTGMADMVEEKRAGDEKRAEERKRADVARMRDANICWDSALLF
jgi:hypothetical protein